MLRSGRTEGCETFALKTHIFQNNNTTHRVSINSEGLFLPAQSEHFSLSGLHNSPCLCPTNSAVTCKHIKLVCRFIRPDQQSVCVWMYKSAVLQRTNLHSALLPLVLRADAGAAGLVGVPGRTLPAFTAGPAKRRHEDEGGGRRNTRNESVSC